MGTMGDMRALLVAVALMGCGGSGATPSPDAAVDAALLDGGAIISGRCPGWGSGDGWNTGLGSCPTFDGDICTDAAQQPGTRPACCDSGGYHYCSQTPSGWHEPYYDAGM